MHFMPDTEDEDSAAERFWPEGYKQVIRDDVRQSVGVRIKDGRRYRHIYQQRFSEEFTDLNQFVGRIADMIVIGAENGADDAFEELMEAFLVEAPLPEARRYARYFWPQALSQRVKKRLQQVIVDEYSQDNIYRHAYDSYYQGKFRSFNEYIIQVARSVVTGAMNDADDMVAAISRSFLTPHPLPLARRYPRRLKLWAPA